LVSCFCLKAGLLVKFPLETMVETTKLASCTLEMALAGHGEVAHHHAPVLHRAAAAAAAAAECRFLPVEPRASEMLPLSFPHSFPLFSVAECALVSVVAFGGFQL
jgi:hypothetical protein